MRTKILTWGLVCLFLFPFLLAQKKPIIEKNLLATTEDGRKVLLKTDGTWEFIKEELKKGWHETKRWKGKGIKNTETFIIKTKEWRICWATKPDEYGEGIFQIMVYKDDSDLPDFAANVMGEDKDCSFMKKKGVYHLTINAAQPWIVIIEQKF